MFSLNVPVPGSVARVAADLQPVLVDAGVERFRDRHSLVVKRFEEEESLPRLRERLRTALRKEPAFEARVTGVDTFEDPPRGPGPVVYLTVDSPGLVALHGRLVDRFGAIAGLEGDGYTPHVTLGRGGVFDSDTLADLSGRVDPVTWTVSELAVYDSRYRETVSRLSLPA
ncbi:2'-5' RNA ligase family protein [Salinigranum sp. GCM10025319]|uniref:2'-5' RNA ligase family protein n=1 Tax=Salinigranum sp. GCM10025319 TaxID=3252687 RepID=UPI0036146154